MSNEFSYLRFVFRVMNFRTSKRIVSKLNNMFAIVEYYKNKRSCYCCPIKVGFIINLKFSAAILICFAIFVSGNTTYCQE